jgi:hypothetical protein
LGAVVLLSLGAVSFASAQDIVADRAAQIAAAARLHPGQTTRLAVPGQGRLNGMTVLDSTGRVAFQPEGAPVSPALGLADTLWLRKTAWLPGMIVGGAIGMGAFWLGYAAASTTCDTGSCNDSAGSLIVISLVPTAIGAALGAGVGALIHKWKRTWVASP